ncbi:hypothetical protein DL96DRAFT_1559825 [Flagelloscypha sp. PMI_526]|nr:hypothetical protein DL96DRAFT_1559825 [Flagelloscypha sp. PMI_526]
MPSFTDIASELQVQVFRELAWSLSKKGDRAKWLYFSKLAYEGVRPVIYHTVELMEPTRLLRHLKANPTPFSKYTKAFSASLYVEEDEQEVFYSIILPFFPNLVYFEVTWFKAVMQLSQLRHLTMDRELAYGISGQNVVIPSVTHLSLNLWREDDFTFDDMHRCFPGLTHLLLDPGAGEPESRRFQKEFITKSLELAEMVIVVVSMFRFQPSDEEVLGLTVRPKLVWLARTVVTYKFSSVVDAGERSIWKGG